MQSILERVFISNEGCWLKTGEFPTELESWNKIVGPTPEQVKFAHRCQVSRCVNPAHLDAQYRISQEERDAENEILTRQNKFGGMTNKTQAALSARLMDAKSHLYSLTPAQQAILDEWLLELHRRAEERAAEKAAFQEQRLKELADTKAEKDRRAQRALEAIELRGKVKRFAHALKGMELELELELQRRLRTGESLSPLQAAADRVQSALTMRKTLSSAD
jgi:hypothetical protein